MKQIHAAAGKRVPVIRRAFSSIPMDYRFSARAAIPGETLGGTVEIRKSRWILPGSPANLPLQPSNIVSAGFWNTFVSVDVIPEVDAIVGFQLNRLPERVLGLFVSPKACPCLSSSSAESRAQRGGCTCAHTPMSPVSYRQSLSTQSS
ncbi:MAG: hypothetical protein HY322_16570 [Betaproteobacteria bacterium]|nr:hypothetical protein [Betaproteobacteria bacterium]